VSKKVTKKKVGQTNSRSTKVSVKTTSKKPLKTTKTASKTAPKTKSVSKKRGTPKKTVKKTSTRKVSSTAPRQSQRTLAKAKTYLTKSELEHFRTLLIEKLMQITGDVDHIEKEILHKSRQDATGDLSSMPIHMADIGSDNYEQEFTLGLMASERKIVQEILMALRRIEDGSFGMCEGTGEPIPKARLEAYPWARYCVRYAEMIEKGQVTEVQNNTYSGGSFAPSLAEKQMTRMMKTTRMMNRRRTTTMAMRKMRMRMAWTMKTRTRMMIPTIIKSKNSM
jgi:RNA polymerase-binding transcription factor DksA